MDPLRSGVRLRDRRGFAMVSVLVAIVLLAIGLVALSTSSAFMVSLQTDASERSTAAAIALSHMELVSMRDPGQLASEEPVRVNETGAESASGSYVRTLSVAPDPNIPDVVRVAVQVEYPSGFGRTRTVEMVTLVYRGQP